MVIYRTAYCLSSGLARARRLAGLCQVRRADVIRTSSSGLAEELGREIAFHPVGENGDDMGLGPKACSGHDGGPVIKPRAGPDGEALANQGPGHLECLI